MPNYIPLSQAEEFALIRGLALNVNPKHGVFKGIPSSTVFNVNGVELNKWRGWTDSYPSTQAYDFYGQFQGLVSYLPDPPQVPGGITSIENNDTMTMISLSYSFPLFTLTHSLGNSNIPPTANSKIKISLANLPIYNGVYTVLSSVFNSPYFVTTLIRDDGLASGFITPAVSANVTYSNNEYYSSKPTSSTTNQTNSGLVFKTGNLDLGYNSFGGIIGNWIAVVGSISNANGTVTQNLTDPTHGPYFSISTAANQSNSKAEIKDWDPRIMPNDIGGAPRFKIGERKLHFKAKVQIEARSSDHAYSIGFWRTHTWSASPTEYQKGENCVCFFNNGSSTWQVKVNKRTGASAQNISVTHAFSTTAQVGNVNTLEILVNSEGTQAIFKINDQVVYVAEGGLPVMSQDATYVSTDYPQVGVFAGATVRDVVPTSGGATAGVLRVYSITLFSQSILQNAGLKLFKKLK